MKRIAVVGCCKTKLPHGAPAQDLYVSPLFKLCRRYAERFCDEWVIFSAGHGLVLPQQFIAPYDQTLPKMSRNDRIQWAMETHWDLVHRYPLHWRDIQFVLLAGGEYGTPLIGANDTMPLAGLGFGKRLAWLKRELAKP